MLEIIDKALKTKQSRGGRKNKLSVEDMILMTLEYLREYRTYKSIGLNYGTSESWAYKTIIWVEEILIKDDRFQLPGKKRITKI